MSHSVNHSLTSRDDEKASGDVVSAYLELAEIGLMRRAAGNVSIRVTGGMLISCSGATAKSLSAERVVFVRDDGTWNSEVSPSTEWRMHTAIYKDLDQANAIVHTHSDFCVALACNNLSLPGFHYLVGTFGGSEVPCVPYSTFGTEQLGRDAAEALTDRAACLLGNHGMICWGSDLSTAIAHAERLEILCRQFVLAASLGRPDILTDGQLIEFLDHANTAGYRELE